MDQPTIYGTVFARFRPSQKGGQDVLVKDIMTKEVVTVGEGTSVRELAKVLSQNGISGVPVVDRYGKVIGIASETDMIGNRGKQVKSIMSKPVEVVENTDVEEVASLMMAHKVRIIPVMRGKKLAGIVSRADIVTAIGMGYPIGMHTPIYDL